MGCACPTYQVRKHMQKKIREIRKDIFENPYGIFSKTPTGPLRGRFPLRSSCCPQSCCPLNFLQTTLVTKALYRSWFSGRGCGQQLFSFQSPAVHWMAWPPNPRSPKTPQQLLQKEKFQKARKPRLSPKVHARSPRVNARSPKANALSPKVSVKYF